MELAETQRALGRRLAKFTFAWYCKSFRTIASAKVLEAICGEAIFPLPSPHFQLLKLPPAPSCLQGKVSFAQPSLSDLC